MGRGKKGGESGKEGTERGEDRKERERALTTRVLINRFLLLMLQKLKFCYATDGKK